MVAHFGAPGAQVATASTADVTLMRLTLSLINKPRITTVRSFICGRLNSLTPIRRNVFLPLGGVVGTSAPCAWLATLGAGSVAATSIQFVPCSRRHPVTLTISTFLVAGACVSNAAIMKVVNTRHIIADVE